VDAALAAGGRVAVLARSAAPGDGRLSWLRMPESPAAYGRALYAALRALDAAGAARILVEAVPEGEAWAAIADRLARAAARDDSGEAAGVSGP
jgi:L-threonylcarbamoyladenylate synthase